MERTKPPIIEKPAMVSQPSLKEIWRDIDNTKFTYYADGCALPPDSTIPTEESFLSILTSTLTGEGSIGKLLVDNIDAKISTVGGASASEVADAVWDETTSGHETTGTFGEKLGKQPFLVDKNSGFIIKT